MIDRPLRTLFVGVKEGTRGGALVQAVARHPRQFQPVAFMDTDTAICDVAAAKGGFKSVTAFSSLAAALEEGGAEAAIISSPARFHGGQVRACLEKGLHVFVAKPMTYDLDEAEALVRLAEGRELCLVVDQQEQFLLMERTVKEWIRSEKYGKLGFVQYTLHRHRPKMGAFTGDNPFAWEQGVHVFNSLMAMTGRRIVAVSACQAAPPWTAYNGPTVAMGILEFEGEVRGILLGTFESLTTSMDLRFECEEAALRIVAEKGLARTIEIAPRGGAFESTGLSQDDDPLPAERFNIDAFYEGCTKKCRVVNDGRDNLATLAVVDAFLRSAKTGRREAVRTFDN